MLPIPERRKAGGPLLGAASPGQSGPFGVRDDDGGQVEADFAGFNVNLSEQPGRDAELLRAVATSSEQRAEATRERFRQRREAAQQRREQLWQARQRGVAQRHGGKLRQLGERDGDGQDEPGPEAA